MDLAMTGDESSLPKREENAFLFLGNYQIFSNLKESKAIFELFLMKEKFAL